MKKEDKKLIRSLMPSWASFPSPGSVFMGSSPVEEEERRLLWTLMPLWAKEPQRGLCPTMYGTLSYEGDLRIHRKLVAILGPPDWTAFQLEEDREGESE